MMVGIQDVHYTVSDMPRAVSFYREVLGMRVLDTSPWWTSLDFFGSRVGLHGTDGRTDASVPHDARGPIAGAVLTLHSTDIEADVDYLRRNGVTIVGRSDNDWGRLAVFRDPDGNFLKLMQPARTR